MKYVLSICNHKYALELYLTQKFHYLLLLSIWNKCCKEISDLYNHCLNFLFLDAWNLMF